MKLWRLKLKRLLHSTTCTDHETNHDTRDSTWGFYLRIAWPSKVSGSIVHCTIVYSVASNRVAIRKWLEAVWRCHRYPTRPLASLILIRGLDWHTWSHTTCTASRTTRARRDNTMHRCHRPTCTVTFAVSCVFPLQSWVGICLPISAAPATIAFL